MTVRKRGTRGKVPAKGALDTGGKAPSSARKRTDSAAAHAQKGQSKKSGGETKNHASWVVLFWVAFAIFIFGLFYFNREAIGDTIQSIRNETAAALPGEGQTIPADEPQGSAASPASPPPAPPPPPAAAESPSTREPPPEELTPLPPDPPQAPPPVAQRAPQTPALPPGRPPVSGQPPARTAPRPAAPNARPPVETRERPLYFTQVDRGGTILRVKVTRKLPVSDSPMTDVIEALITGPNGEEKNRGLISLIPPNTRVLSVTVRGETAYINFSEDFQYNSYGVEGYAGTLRQLVFTATEFPNVKDVQILIEGRRVDYLGEGVWIGSPVNRDML